MRDPDCIFCKIIAGEMPCSKVFENEGVLAFMDINPTSRGHVLVIPKGHAVDLASAEVGPLREVMTVLPRIAAAAVAAVGAEGFNILQSNGACAGQVVPHVHFHIVPRVRDDGIGLGFRQRDPVKDDFAATAEAIRAELRDMERE
jgi:histidine triad (HIT) family protein